MRDKLIQYVNLLFAGKPDTEDIKQEILQNTLDRYDDLVQQGKQPEAAYSLAISGIGDISELLGSSPAPGSSFDPTERAEPEYRETPAWKKLLRAGAVCLYILSVIPLFVLSELGMDVLGLCGTIAMIAVATAMIIVAGGKEKARKEPDAPMTPQQELHTAVDKIISTITLVIYLIISFTTMAWHITWLAFPIAAAVKGLVKACMDLKEASEYEN